MVPDGADDAPADGAPTEEERAATLRAFAAQAAAADPHHRRFGARHHRYAWAPPLSEARVEELERAIGAPLPASYRRFVTTIGDGGCGPYHGLLPLDHAVQHAIAAGTFDPTAPGRALYRGVIGLGHVGCGQVTMLIVRGDAAGEVWIDARACGAGVFALAPDFDVHYLAWVTAVARNELPRAFAPPGACPLPRALSAYLRSIEARTGAAPGSLAPHEVGAALRALPVDAIRIEASGDDPFFAPGDPLDPCPACEALIANLGRQGLARDRVQDGKNPLAEGRSRAPRA